MDGRSAVDLGWRWDPTLYAGAAVHYSAGRVPYPPTVTAALVAALGLDGTGRLLDIGCGPGSLTLPLAPHFAEAIGVDADADMLAEAVRLAYLQNLSNTVWRHLRAEDLPADLPLVDVIVLAQSFHWMDRHRVAAAARALLVPGGAVVHVHATTHKGAAAEPSDRGALTLPPWSAIAELIRRCLGPQPRAGQSILSTGAGGGEASVYRAAGFAGPEHLSVPEWTVERSAEQIVAAVHSLSGAAPHLFAAQLAEFDSDLRQLLADASRTGRFEERMPGVDMDIWR